MINYKKYRKTKVAIATLVFISILSICCSSKQIKNQYLINKIDLNYSIPIVKTTGELEYLKDTISIFYNKSAIVYRLPITYSSENDSLLLKKEKRFNYFIFNSKKSFGYFFDSLNAHHYQIMNVDSLLRIKAFYGNDYFDSSNDSLIFTKKIGLIYTMVEKYIPKGKPDDSYPDSTIFYYGSKLNGFIHSFSKTLEKEKDMKIYKVRMIYNKQNSTTYNITIPYREFTFEFIKDTISATSEYSPLFEQFESSMSYE